MDKVSIDWAWKYWDKLSGGDSGQNWLLMCHTICKGVVQGEKNARHVCKGVVQGEKNVTLFSARPILQQPPHHAFSSSANLFWFRLFRYAFVWHCLVALAIVSTHPVSKQLWTPFPVWPTVRLLCHPPPLPSATLFCCCLVLFCCCLADPQSSDRTIVLHLFPATFLSFFGMPILQSWGGERRSSILSVQQDNSSMVGVLVLGELVGCLSKSSKATLSPTHIWSDRGNEV